MRTPCGSDQERGYGFECKKDQISGCLQKNPFDILNIIYKKYIFS
jgi:hypothetical protein